MTVLRLRQCWAWAQGRRVVLLVVEVAELHLQSMVPIDARAMVIAPGSMALASTSGGQERGDGARRQVAGMESGGAGSGRRR